MLPLGHEPAVALAKPHLGLPGDVADRLGEGLLTLLHLTAHLGVVAIGPGALDEGTPGVSEAEVTHELSWTVKTIPELRDGAEGHGELDPTQGLEGFDHGMESPAFGLFLQLGLDALHSLVVFVDRPHVLLEDDLLGGSGTDHLGEPSPARLPFVTDILAQQEGLEPVLGGFQISDGVLTRTRETRMASSSTSGT
jgi:hypothetical protein